MPTLINQRLFKSLRAYKTSGLDINITAGYYMLNGTKINYAGSTQTMMANETNFVEIDEDGVVYINQGAFTEGLLPIAEVVAGASSISSVTDRRPFLSSGNSSVPSTTWKNGIPSGDVDGVNDTFLLPDSPDPDSLLLVLDGKLLSPGVGNDYTLLGDTITFTTPPEEDSLLVYFYTNTAAYSQAMGGLTGQEITSASASMAVGNAYIANNANRVQLRLPTNAQVGHVVAVVGKGLGGWRITQNAGQTIYWDNDSSTPGVSGFLESTQIKQVVHLMCIQQNTDFEVISYTGNPILG